MPKQPTFRLVKKTRKDIGGTEWGWLSPQGELWFVPSSGGQHDVVALKICEMFRIASSTVMEKMGWIRVDKADIRALHICGNRYCMTQAQHDFLKTVYARLEYSETDTTADGKTVVKHRRVFRDLVAQADIRDTDSNECEEKGLGVLVTAYMEPSDLGWKVRASV
jgi:hypothetical protein